MPGRKCRFAALFGIFTAGFLAYQVIDEKIPIFPSVPLGMNSPTTETTETKSSQATTPPAHVDKCSTRWYKALNIEFEAFSVNNFGKVTFLMDAFYSKIVKDRLYSCVFFEASEHLDAPSSVSLTTYLCVGYAEEAATNTVDSNRW